MRKLILHIGISKTGSTSLRLFLHSNHAVISELGVALPTFDDLLGGDPHHNGAVLSAVYNLRRGACSAQQPEHVEASLRRLNEAFDLGGTVLLTDERLYSYPPVDYSPDHPHRNQQFWREVARIVEELRIEQTHIIVYLRCQVEHVASVWKQKTRGNLRDDFHTFAFSEWCHYLYLYAERLQEIEETLPGCTMHVRVYDRARFEGGDICRDFFHAAGIPWDERLVVSGQDYNLSSTFDVAEALRTIGPIMGTPRWGVVKALALKLSKMRPDPAGTSPFTEEEARLFMERFRASNEELAARYFGGEAPFPQDWTPTHLWRPNKARIAFYAALFRLVRDSPRFEAFARKLARVLPVRV